MFFHVFHSNGQSPGMSPWTGKQHWTSGNAHIQIPQLPEIQIREWVWKIKKGSYRHVWNVICSLKTSEGQIAFGGVLKSLPTLRNHSHNYLCN